METLRRLGPQGWRRARDVATLGHEAGRAERPGLRPGQSIELLKELHILTREGRLNQDSRRKLKQVYHLYQFIEKLLLRAARRGRRRPTLADHGAGKSYLGFILYDLFFQARGARATSTASRPAPNWSNGRARWPRGWVSSACRSCNLSVAEAADAARAAGAASTS